MHTLTFALLLAASVLWAVPAAAGDVYYWVTEEGVHSYSDSLKQVPNRYRGEARKSRLNALESYDRWTPSDRAKEADYVRRLPENLARLRAFNASDERGDAAAAAERTTLQVGPAGSNVQLNLPAQGSGRQPVVVQTARAELPGEDATRNITFVRSGDETLAVLLGNRNEGRVVQLSSEELEVLLERP